MHGAEKIINNFNRLLAHELIAANQYFLNSRIFKHWGLVRLSNIEHQEYKDEIKHADNYINRILFLEGVIAADIQSYNFCNMPDSVEEILRNNLNLENSTADNLRECIEYAGTVHDFVSRDIMVNILIDEEQHIDFLKTEIALITRLGMANYLQSQLHKIFE